jgi:nitrate/nitrite transporter NarK
MDAKTLKTIIEKQVEKLNRKDIALLEGVQIVMLIVVMLIVGVIGLFIGDKVLVVAGNFSDANLTLAKNSLTSTVSTGFSFLVILVVATIGGVALAYVMTYMGRMFQSRQQGGAM